MRLFRFPGGSPEVFRWLLCLTSTESRGPTRSGAVRQGHTDKPIFMQKFTFCQLFLVRSFVAIFVHLKITLPTRTSKAVKAREMIGVTFPPITTRLPHLKPHQVELSFLLRKTPLHLTDRSCFHQEFSCSKAVFAGFSSRKPLSYRFNHVPPTLFSVCKALVVSKRLPNR